MKLKIANFTYVSSGKKTDRQILVLSEPSDSYLGVEYDEDDMSDIAGYLDYLEEKEQFDRYLKEKYNINSNPEIRFRTFKEDKIVGLTEEKITV